MTSYSRLLTHRQCPQKYAYAHVHGIESIEDFRSPERIFGSWWHLLRALTSIQRSESMRATTHPDAPPIVTPEVLRVDDTWTVAVADLDRSQAVTEFWELFTLWDRSLTNDYRDRFVERMGDQPLPRLRDMNDEWWDRWHDDMQHELPLAVELRVSRHLPTYRDVLTGEEVKPDEMLNGVIDEIYRDTRRGFNVIRDYKTHRKLDGATSQSDMMESQLHLYAWAAAPVLQLHGIKQPRAVAYDRIRSVAPKQPQVTKAGKLSASVKDYSLLTYLRWLDAHDGEVPFPGMKKDGSGAGTYTLDPSVVENLSDPASRSAWAQRTLVPMNAAIVKSHLSAATLTYLDTTRTDRLVEKLGEAPRSFGTCKFCDFLQLCQAQLVGGSEGDYDLEAFGLINTRHVES